jgi:hypothetical protein
MIELPCQINDDYYKKLKQIETVKDRLQQDVDFIKYDVKLLKHYNKELKILEKKREAYKLSLERDY